MVKYLFGSRLPTQCLRFPFHPLREIAGQEAQAIMFPDSNRVASANLVDHSLELWTIAGTKQYDNREPIADLKRLMESNPKLGFAFRTAVEKVKSGELTAEDTFRQYLCKAEAGQLVTFAHSFFLVSAGASYRLALLRLTGMVKRPAVRESRGDIRQVTPIK